MSYGRRCGMRKNRGALPFYAILSALVVLLISASPALAGTLNVPADYPTIQSAINAAVDGDTIQVAEGTYYETLWWGSKAIALVGAGAEITIIDAGGSGQCLRMVNVPETARVEGLTFTGGAAAWGPGMSLTGSSPTLADNIITGNSSSGGVGGVSVIEGAPVLLNNIISHNSTDGMAGGIWIWDSSATLTGNTIAHNSAGTSSGGIRVTYSVAILRDNVICYNSARNTGGGLSAYRSSVTLTGNVISDNSCDIEGGGVLLGGCESATLTNNIITGNSVTVWAGGGVWIGSGSYTLSNNVIAENSAWKGGGVHLAGNASAVLTNNTIVGNLATEGGGIGSHGDLFLTLTNNTVAQNTGGGILCPLASVITNCILWGNSGGPDLMGSWATYSDIGTGELAGEGNISADPLFLDPTAGDYHLQPGSPCIDVGNDLAPGLTDTDKDGNPRIVGAAVDMGAYEYQAPWNHEAVAAILALVGQVQALNLQQGIDNSLDAKLDSALNALDDINENNNAGAVGSLQALINAVAAQRGHKIPEADADALIAHAQAIIDALSGE